MSTAATQGRHRAAPPRARRRRPLVVALVVTLLLLAAGGAGAWWLLRPAPDHTPTTAENIEAAALIGRLTVPSGAERDVTATACGTAVRYCVSTPTVTYRELFDGVVRQLRTLGAGVRNSSCGQDDDARFACTADLTYRGGRLSVLAGDRSPQGATVTSWVAVADALDSPPPARTALGTDWRRLDAVPPGWNGKLTCSERTAAGCVAYRGSFLQPTTPQQAAEALQVQLDAAGYRVDQTATPDRRLIASRYRGAGGTEQVLVLATVRTSGDDFTQVTVYVSAA